MYEATRPYRGDVKYKEDLVKVGTIGILVFYRHGIKETTEFFHGRLHDDLFGQICSQAPLELTVLLSFSRLESPNAGF